MEMVQRLSFVNAFIAKVGDDYYVFEERIMSQFRKFNSNTAFENTARSMPYDALSHFSLYHTDDEYLLCDLQGGLQVLTDPQVHSSKLELN